MTSLRDIPRRPIGRRLALATGVAGLLPTPALGSHRAGWWESYCARFVNASGRVVDGLHTSGTHSEGQAWAMLLAVRAGDEDGFDLIRRWTLNHMSRRDDALLAWLHHPQGGVADHNNATDADLYHALALSEADRLWPWKRLAGEARRIADDCLRLLLRRRAGMWVLLPGATGFEGLWHADLNPSYVLPAIFRRLREETGKPAWEALDRDGARLLAATLFSRWRLPPDWVRLNGVTRGFSPVPGRPFRFGYDALRIPMNLAWGGDGSHVAFQAVSSFWAREFPPPPAWVSLDDGRLSPFRGDQAHVAVQALTSGSSAVALLDIAAQQAGGHYYGATLLELCRQVARGA